MIWKKKRYLRFESKMNGTYKVGDGKYLDDLIDMDDVELYKEYKKEYEDVAARFAKPITCPDTYLEHVYKDSPAGRYYDDLQHDIKELMSKSDFIELAYEYPHHTVEPCYFRFDELFRTGCDIRYLPAIYTGSYASKNEITVVKAFYALINVFGDQ